MELSRAKVGCEAAAGLRGLCEERLGLPGVGHGGFQPLVVAPLSPSASQVVPGGGRGERWENTPGPRAGEQGWECEVEKAGGS